MTSPILVFPTDRDHLTRAELAQVFSVTQATLRTWERERGLPCRKLGKRRIYIVAEVKEWVADVLMAA